MNIQIVKKFEYGHVRRYFVDDSFRDDFRALTGRSTLREEDIPILLRMGYSITEQDER